MGLGDLSRCDTRSDGQATSTLENWRERQLWTAASGVGCRNAPMSQNTGKKIPKKNIHPCPFLSVTSPSVSNKTTYRMKPPIPIPHHIGASFVSTDLDGAPTSGRSIWWIHRPGIVQMG